MMINKKMMFSIIATVSLSVNAQKATFTLTEYIPESASITRSGVYDAGFENSFFYMMAHGLTVFNQSTELFLYDSKTMTEKKKIDYPKFKGFDAISLYTKQFGGCYGYSSEVVELNKNLVFLFSAKADKPTSAHGVKITGIYGAKIDESLTLPSEPQLLLTTSDPVEARVSSNDKRTMCIFSYVVLNKKNESNTFNIRVFDSNLKLLKADSIPYEYKGMNYASAFIYDNGYAIWKNDKGKAALTIVDLKTNKTNNVLLANGSTTLEVSKFKGISGDKVVVFGTYSSMDGKKVKNGYFKATIKGNSVEEQVYYDHVIIGEDEQEKSTKCIDRVTITDKGACYAVISQGSTYGKYEVVYINNANDKWKKAIPMPAGNQWEVNLYQDVLKVCYMDYEGDNSKIDVNNYVYGKPKPSIPVTLRQTYKSNVSVLNITPSGNITRDAFIENHYNMISQYRNGFIAVHQGLNGQITSKCKVMKITYE